MSTVSKRIADDIIKGKYPEDNITCIIQYQNMFNRQWAYKLIPQSKDTAEYRTYLLEDCDSMIYPSIYWEKK